MSIELRQGTRVERGVPELGTGLSLSQTIDGRPYISAGAAGGSGVFTDINVTGPPVSGAVATFGGNVNVNGNLNAAQVTAVQQLAVGGPAYFAASAAAGPSARFPHGSAPNSPQNGDVWTTTTGMYVRINGTTVGPLGASGGGVSGALTADSLLLDGPARPTGNYLDVLGNASFFNINVVTNINASTGVFNTYVATVYCTTTQYFETAGFVKTGASTTATASLKIPHGVAPNSPQNGDIWTTLSGMYVRINNVTVGPLGAGGGSAPDATTISKGIVQLAGALTGIASSPSIAGGVITPTNLTQALLYNIYARS